MGDYTKEIHFGGKVLVIWGNNATLDAGGKGQFFTGDGSKGLKTSLELHGLVMQNGYSDSAVSFSFFFFLHCAAVRGNGSVWLCPTIRSKYEMSLKYL